MRKFYLLILMIIATIFLVGCESPKVKYNEYIKSDEIKIVATTTMLGDLAKNIGGNKVKVYTMMPAGVDPHTYNPNKLDIDYLLAADVVLVSGLHLEAQAGEAIKQVRQRNITVIEASKILVLKHKNNHEDGVTLIDWDDENAVKDAERDGINEVFDPHFWFDVIYWRIVAEYLKDELIKKYPNYQDYFELRHQSYQNEIDILLQYITSRLSELTLEQKILFTAHDAFNYFGIRYGFQIEAVQGISTEHEANTRDIEKLVDLAIEKNVKTIFIESSVPRKTIDSLIESAKVKNHHIKIGGELFSDSLGNPGEFGDTYIQMVKHNIDTIVDAILLSDKE